MFKVYRHEKIMEYNGKQNNNGLRKKKRGLKNIVLSPCIYFQLSLKCPRFRF